MKYTDEKIKNFSPSARAKLYRNALKSGTPDGSELAGRIEKLGLRFSDSAVPKEGDPLVEAMGRR